MDLEDHQVPHLCNYIYIAIDYTWLNGEVSRNSLQVSRNIILSLEDL